MLGHKLVEALNSAGFEAVPVPEDKVDIRRRNDVETAVSEIRPSFVINAAAYTDVDGCENNSDLAFDVNAAGAGNIARSAEDAGAPNLFISTDYVFDGRKKTPYVETDSPNPTGIYAESKFEGEKAVMRESDRWFIIRTSWLFGPGGKNFVDTISNLAATRDSVNVVNDQTGCPTYTAHLAAGVTRILKIYIEKNYGETGIYHLCGAGSCSWFEFAKKISDFTPGEKKAKILPVSTSEYADLIKKKMAHRPFYSVLSTDKVKKNYGLVLPHWIDSLSEYLNID